ncbi:MAG: hypothetical protein LPK49_05585, partial [Bacteroidota bacterium]|nr:hypothetical protein [Bacteroidota bacterium]
MSFVEDGKYKQVMTYYDGLLKHRQVQTRFNSNPTQTIVAQSLYDHEGRPVINSLPIPVNGVAKFSYLDSFLRPAGYPEYTKLMYDAIPDTTICPPREYPIDSLDPDALANRYYSANNPNTSGINAFIPDAEGYPMVRKILAAENSDKVLFEGQAGSALQLGNEKHTEYMYGSPIQAELNRYFGQDVGKYNYYRKMITSDNHGQEMFSITDDEGRIVASGLIGSPDTTELALSIRNLPDTGFFHSNLLPVPNIRVDEHWRNNGSYFIESKDVNYEFKYQIDYVPFKPCLDTPIGLSPKVYYDYEIIDPCGVTILRDSGALGQPGLAACPLNHSAFSSKHLTQKGNYTWKKYSYIKIDDLRASVDAYLAGGYFKCFLTLDSFLKREFVQSTDFPCQSNYDPCGSLRLAMIKEMYPLAKYGDYQYTDSSKLFAGSGNNSIFSLNGSDYMYWDDCLPDTVNCGDTTYNIKDMMPQ